MDSSPEQPAFADIPTLGKWLREGKTSPTKLTEVFLERLTRIGPDYNAVVNILPERALAEAKQAEEDLKAGRDRGPLHGIPYGAKDLIDAKGAPTTWGAAPNRQRMAEEDATVIQKLSSAGAVLVAKLATVELAGGMGYEQPDASLTGPGINPWNKQAWSGGSSSGPAAAVAAGLVPFAIGSETWGSIVVPASFCGVTGLRPTYGRVSRRGVMALSWTMDKLGPLARSAEDAGIVLATIAGPDPGDPTTLPGSPIPMSAPFDRPLRLAVLAESADYQPAVRNNFETSLELLKKMGTVTKVELPDLPYDEAASLIISAEMSSALEDWIGTEKAERLQAPEDRLGGIADELIFAKDYLRALRIRGKAITALTSWLGEFDALVTAGTSVVASPIDEPFSAYFSQFGRTQIGGPANLVGLPAVCVPNGFGERDLPTSLLLTGKPLSEAILVRIADDFQKQTDWHQRYPAIA